MILADAKKKADELRKKTETDVRMAAQKTIATMRQRIGDMIATSLAGEATEEVLDDKQFLKRIIEKVIEKWDLSEYSKESLIIKLPKEDIKELEKYFFEKAKQKMKEKISFAPNVKIKAGFIIEPKDGKFKIGFSENDFNELFAFFLRPKIRQFLFGEVK